MSIKGILGTGNGYLVVQKRSLGRGRGWLFDQKSPVGVRAHLSRDGLQVECRHWGRCEVVPPVHKAGLGRPPPPHGRQVQLSRGREQGSSSKTSLPSGDPARRLRASRSSADDWLMSLPAGAPGLRGPAHLQGPLPTRTGNNLGGCQTLGGPAGPAAPTCQSLN